MELLPEILFSTIFVLIGSVVFHLSALVSGYSLFRELPNQLSVLGAMVVGLILFIITPVGYLSFFPECFVSECFSTQEMKSQINRQSEVEQEKYESMDASRRLGERRLLYPKTFQMYLSFKFALPFVVAAAGLGLLFGCMKLVSSRESFLVWLRRKLHLYYRIYTYQHVWDGFFDSLKHDGHVRVSVKGKVIDGWMAHHSIRDEPHAIELHNYRVFPQDGCGGGNVGINPGSVVILNSDIEMIEADSNSFNRRYESMPLRSQSFYTMIAALGFVMLAWSLLRTESLVAEAGFIMVSTTYTYLAGMVLLAASVLVLISLYIFRVDSERFYSGFLLSPSIVVVGGVVLSLVVFLVMQCMPEIVGLLSVKSLWITAVVLFFVVSLRWLWGVYSPSGALYRSFCCYFKKSDAAQARAALDWLFHNINLNAGTPDEFHNAIKAMKALPEYRKSAYRIENIVNDFIRAYPMFRDEEVNVLIKLRDIISW